MLNNDKLMDSLMGDAILPNEKAVVQNAYWTIDDYEVNQIDDTFWYDAMIITEEEFQADN